VIGDRTSNFVTRDEGDKVMPMTERNVLFACVLGAFALGGCAVTIPEPLQGDYLQEPLPIRISEEHQEQPVRWGGTLLGTLEDEQERCMVLLARRLDHRYRPDPGAEAAGRFLACDRKSSDTEDFLPGSVVTVVGVFERIGESIDDQGVVRFPIVRLRSAYAWPITAREIEPFETAGQANRSSGAGPRSIDRYINR
jgi:starvation-inducible outer membrane lipoprotein